MFRSTASVWFVLSFGVTACFGRVRFDYLASDHPDEDQPSFDAPLTGGMGGMTPRTEPLEPGPHDEIPREEEPVDRLCTSDCCPQELAVLTVPAFLDVTRSSPYFSGDGRFIALSSSTYSEDDQIDAVDDQVYLYDLSERTLLHATRSVSSNAAQGRSEPFGISHDGRWVILTSWASDLVEGDENGQSDVFLFDREDQNTRLLSRTPAGTAGNGSSLARDISPDGRFVVFSSASSDLTEGDNNEGWDVFVWDRETGQTRRVSMGEGDQQTNPVPGNHAHISADGRFVSFHSLSDLLMPGDQNAQFDIFLADLAQGTTTRVSRSALGSETDGSVFVLGMSDDARFLSSYASATNLIDNDTNGVDDVFLLDREQGAVRRVNLGLKGEQADVGTRSAVLSHDGKYLSFASDAETLSTNTSDGVVAGSTTSQSYVYDVTQEQLVLLSRTPRGTPGNAPSDAAQLSATGRCYVFTSSATDLAENGRYDDRPQIFVGRLP